MKTQQLIYGLIALFIASIINAGNIAAVDQWTVRTDRAETKDLVVIRGETKLFRTIWNNPYTPHDFAEANETVFMYRPYDYTGTNWHYTIYGSVAGSNITEVIWRPSADTGLSKYKYQIEVRGNTNTLPAARGILRI